MTTDSSSPAYSFIGWTERADTRLPPSIWLLLRLAWLVAGWQLGLGNGSRPLAS